MRLVLLVCALLTADPSADSHLLAGAERFRSGEYAAALVEFEVAGKLGDKEARWYVAASRVKLDQPGRALEEFALADRDAPGQDDAVIGYYRALACYGLQLYTCADRLLAATQGQVGPQIGALVQTLREKLTPVLTEVPATETIDLYLRRGEDHTQQGQLAVAQLEFDEAARLSDRRPDHHRRDEALAALARLHTGTRANP